MIDEGEKGKRKLVCGTTKEKHKAKNLKTAGKFMCLIVWIYILFVVYIRFTGYPAFCSLCLCNFYGLDWNIIAQSI